MPQDKPTTIKKLKAALAVSIVKAYDSGVTDEEMVARLVRAFTPAQLIQLQKMTHNRSNGEVLVNATDEQREASDFFSSLIDGAPSASARASKDITREMLASVPTPVAKTATPAEEKQIAEMARKILKVRGDVRGTTPHSF